jgi:hypothetical protein
MAQSLCDVALLAYPVLPLQIDLMIVIYSGSPFDRRLQSNHDFSCRAFGCESTLTLPTSEFFKTYSGSMAHDPQ